MTCYLRMHEVVLGIGRPERALDWESLFDKWQRVTSLAERNAVLSDMAIEPIDVYTLPKTDLRRFAALVVSDRVDQEFLSREHGTIRAFLDDGGVIVFSGRLFRSWLPGGGAFVPQPGAVDPTTLVIGPHPIFGGVLREDLATAFIPGHHPAPDGAEILAALPGGEAIAYIDRATTRGTIVLIQAGHDLLGYSRSKTSVRRIVPNLLGWLDQGARA